jgi:glyoxylase-like metal-dependent hydrolase (beta-lactamase superfamily II)
MTLEDHLGDIIRKAREAAHVTIEAAAQGASLSPEQLQQFEENGESAKAPDLNRLAELIGLNGQKLGGIAKGWMPKQVDLSCWREVRQIATEGEGYTVNAYLVWDEVNREAAIFDTGWDAAPLIKIIEENELQPKHLFITHSHDDHIAGLAKIRERFPKIRLHSGSKHAPPDQRNRANDFIHLGSLRITNRETPGHAEDGVTYIVGNFPEDASNIAIVGDCIFAGSMGRGFQSSDLLKQKVREQIFTLPGDTVICPGHGPLTTVAEEKANNPFF